MKQKIFDLLRKKQNNQISPEEDQELHQWVSASEENQASAKAMEQIWPLSERYGEQASMDTEAALGRLLHRIQTHEEKPSPKVRPLHRSLRWIAIAASFILALGFGYHLWTSNATTPQWATVKTTDAESTALDLKDGSKVWVNQQSTINYPANIDQADRTLSLYGEAYFEVAPDKDRPFVVELNDARVEVLGTAFNIRSYPKGEELVLTVSHGKVRFTELTEQKSWELEVKDQLIYNRRTGEATKQRDEYLWSLAWQTGELNFDNTALSKVLPALERYYNITVALDNPQAANCRINVTLTSETVAEALQIIARTSGLEVVELSKNNFLLKGRGKGCE